MRISDWSSDVCSSDLKPPKYGVELRDRSRAQLGWPPPEGMASWDGGSLAIAQSVSDDAVWRALRKEGIQLQRHRSWCVSTDPEFAAKAADVIGLYLNPPQNALVLSVDEKPSIQALERARGYVQTSSGKIVQGMKSTYKRHGRSEEHTSELQSLMRISYAVFCLKKKKQQKELRTYNKTTTVTIRITRHN